MLGVYLVLLVFTSLYSFPQSRKPPLLERFDSVVVPALPQGWLTTANRSASGDFTTTTSAPFSGSAAVLSTNATISQELHSPILDFTSANADSLIFYERRSSTHNSAVLVEASIDGGMSFPFRIGDTLQNPGTTAYVARSMKLPPDLDNQPLVRLRWRIAGNGAGTSGTLRIDDVEVTTIAHSDLAVVQIAFLPPSPVEGSPVEIAATLRNAGSQTLSDISVEFYLDENNDSLPGIGELIGTSYITSSVDPGGAVVASDLITGLAPGMHSFIVRCTIAGDQNPGNNELRASLSVGVPRNALVINEIMYDPESGGSEYVELFNRSASSADLNGWKLSDVIDTMIHSTAHTLSRSPMNVPAGGYILVANDSSIFSSYPSLRDSTVRLIINKTGFTLNNEGDNIILYDFAGRTIDSLTYLPSWHNPMVDVVKGKSLERIVPSFPSNDPRNWSTSADPSGGTPGRKNSLSTNFLPLSGSLSCSPSPFSPDGDGFEDVTIVSYVIPSTTGLIRARIFDSAGRLVRTLADGEPAGSHGFLIWNGMNDRGERVRMGIYVILIEVINAGEEFTIKGVVVVAARMR